MKKKLQDSHENNGNHGSGVFASGGKACGKAQTSTKRSFCQRKTEGGLQKWLANLWSRKKITKKVHAGRGQETKWEIPVILSQPAARTDGKNELHFCHSCFTTATMRLRFSTFFSASLHASVAVALMYCAPAFGFEPHPVPISSGAYREWCASNHVKVFADLKDDRLVEFIVLVEKPTKRDIYWRLNLSVFFGTNQAAWVHLGDDTLGPEFWALARNNEYSRKTIQRFSFSLASDLIPNSSISFVQSKRATEMPAGAYSPTYIVSINDMYRYAKSSVQGNQHAPSNSLFDH